MPNLVKGKLLLGWMPKNEALRVLKNCYFEKTLNERAATKLWRDYRDKVLALPQRDPGQLQRLALTECERLAIEAHVQRLRSGPNGCYFEEVIKVHPGDLIAHQLDVVTDQCQKYGLSMQDEQLRINAFLGVGLEFNGAPRPRQTSRHCTDLDLPHFEFVPRITPQGIDFKERDRYVQIVSTPNDRLLLWGGYHRTHAVLCQLAGDAAAVAPLLTKMRGAPDVDAFFSRPSPRRDAVLGERPPLLRDFFDPDLFITVNLRKFRAVGRVEELRPGKFRAGVIRVPDDS